MHPAEEEDASDAEGMVLLSMVASPRCKGRKPMGHPASSSDGEGWKDLEAGDAMLQLGMAILCCRVDHAPHVALPGGAAACSACGQGGASCERCRLKGYAHSIRCCCQGPRGPGGALGMLSGRPSGTRRNCRCSCFGSDGVRVLLVPAPPLTTARCAAGAIRCGALALMPFTTARPLPRVLAS